MSALITEGETLFHAIKFLGSLYLVWFGVRLFLTTTPVALSSEGTSTAETLRSYFTHGLVTDLANPQTILFFASIFAVTLISSEFAAPGVVSAKAGQLQVQ